jgi:tRNA modification GTPase
MSERETIFALSSGRAPAAIAVVRISGPRASGALRALTGKVPSARTAALARVRDPQTHEIIDEAIALWFPAPASETGEDVAELQLHGGRAVIAVTLSALGKLQGLRPAEAGEFTRRAFENGKLDLTEVEGLADLVLAETEAQRRQAFRQLQGLLGGRAEAWRQQLIRAQALTEATIDFADEGDVPADVVKPALEAACALETEITAVLADDHRGERLREGLVVAIAGPPNVGKSTLLNRIARREAAIVSPYAGTTRDVIEVHLDLAGLPVTLLDTAGIRDSGDELEMEGVRRARARAAAADLVLWVEDAAQPLAESTEKLAAPVVWRVHNKIDRLPGISEHELTVLGRSEPKFKNNFLLANMVNQKLMARDEQQFNNIEREFNISAKTGLGLDALLTSLTRHADDYLAGAESALITRERHRRALKDTVEALRRALSEQLGCQPDLIAEELRLAARSLGRLTGRVDVEDILDVIFHDFCIGK